MKREELNQILEKHRHWVNRDCEGWRNMRANLRGADLCEAELYGANLLGADLYGADLRDADLYGANLRESDLYGAYLRESDLRNADLRGANMYRADLRDADLRDADLREAHLYGADLRGADLYGADLRDADLRDADLREAKNIPNISLSCPSDGAFVGWKKAKCKSGDIIVKLEIPEDAKRSSATGIKCRCDKAKVLGFYDRDGNTVSSDMEVWSKYDRRFKYCIGEIVSVSNFDDDRYNECAPGIHFFIDREEAIKYM